MSRRALTQLLGTVLAFGLAVAGLYQSVPYVALSPGPAYDTLGSVYDASAKKDLPVLTVTGRRTYPTDGTLDLTTVSVRDQITLFEALSGWLSAREAVVPREIVFPPDQSRDQADRENAQLMQQSQDDATTAALTELGVPSVSTVSVSKVTDGGPSVGLLKSGDVITSVDGTAVKDSASLRALISRRAPGQSVVIGYRRDGTAGTATISTVSSAEATPRAVIGITPAEQSSFPGVKVAIRLKDVGGPSAGLMFALGIIDKLTPDSLTGGRKIAGTGEITVEGTVGPIGGIAQKLLGARGQGATVFLVPDANCAEAKANKPSGLMLVRVKSLKGALSSLATVRSGGTPPSC